MYYWILCALWYRKECESNRKERKGLNDFSKEKEIKNY